MNTEQLNSARLARWSQNGEARLTQEAAAEWLRTIGLCSYLPTGPAVAAPGASFLEAVVGRPAQMPSMGERARASELLARLIENAWAVPLKLGSSLGEQPDFVASDEAFRFIYALRGNRHVKAGPSTVGNEKMTTLSQHCWQAIEQNGPLTVASLQPILGRDITEAAVARALQELWTGLYVFPILSAQSEPAQWELLARRFPQQVAAASTTGHAEAHSAMVSLYLHATVAATEEDVLAFLSPLAPQSKLREVLRALGSMRQLDMIDIGGRSHLCLQGGLLPEMVAQLSEEQLALAPAQPEIEIEAAGAELPRKFVPKKFVPRPFAAGRLAGAGSPQKGMGSKGFATRPSGERPGKFFRERSPEESRDRVDPQRGASFASGGQGRAPQFSNSRSASLNRQAPGGNFPPRTRNDDRGVPPYRQSSQENASGSPMRGPGERAKRWEKSREAPGGGPTQRREFGSKSTGFKKSAGFQKSAGFSAPRGAKPWTRQGVAGPGGSSYAPGGKKPWSSRPSGAAGDSRFPGSHVRDGNIEKGRKRWERAGSGPDSGAGPRKFQSSQGKPSGYTASGFRSAGSRSAESGFGARPSGSKPFAAKSGGAKPWASKGAASRVGSKRSYVARTSEGEAPRSKGKTYGKPAGAKPWSKRSSEAAGEGGERPQRREGTDAAAVERGKGKPFWAKNPRGGKGSTAAGRTNRPGAGKKPGKKK